MSSLKFDLNELVSNEISEQIEDYKNQIEILQSTNSELRADNKRLSKLIDNSTVVIELFTHLRKSFSEIKYIKGKDSYSSKTISSQQYEFIKDIMIAIFSCKSDVEYKGGALATSLAISFYNSKNTVINVIKLLMEDHAKHTDFISSFRMPYDYSKDEIMAYVKAPNYNTNGAIFGISSYWIAEGAGKRNMPHDLIMKSPFILQEDIFEALIESIKKRVSNYHYLFALPEYANCSLNQIQRMGELLPYLPQSEINYTNPLSFLTRNLRKLNESTLDWFYDRATHTNQFNTLHWENFPVNYQTKYLLEKPFKELLAAITNYSCRWTDEEKENLLIEYSMKKSVVS